jgi:hypothetical protein
VAIHYAASAAAAEATFTAIDLTAATSTESLVEWITMTVIPMTTIINIQIHTLSSVKSRAARFGGK